MRRKRRIERRPHHDRWLVSYADFITLLFALFVVMYSAAQLDKRRAGKLATAIQTAFLQHGSLPDKPADVGGLAATGVPTDLPVGNTEDSEFNLLKNQIEKALAGEIASGEVAVRRSGEGLVVSLREVGFFDSGRKRSRQVPREPLPGWRMFYGRPTVRSGLRGIPTMFLYIIRDSPRTGIFLPHARPPRSVS
jgi:chemotaxis protein MotB